MFSKKKEASKVKFFWSYWLRNLCLFNCITGLVSESAFTLNLLTSLKNSWNLQKSTCLLLFNNSEPNWVRKSSFSPDLRFQNCLITRWLPTTSILLVKEWICSYQFHKNYLKTIIFWPNFPSIFTIYIKFSMFWNKKEASIVKSFWSYWLRNMCSFNCITGLVSESPLAVNPLTSLKNTWNLQKSTFILLFQHFELKWARKKYFSSDLRL